MTRHGLLTDLLRTRPLLGECALVECLQLGLLVEEHGVLGTNTRL